MKALAAVLVLLSGAALAQDNSGLDELTTREELRGFEPVGRVDIADGGFCTGALIAADLVLTAAHCVLDRDGTAVDAGQITFKAGLSHGVALAEVPVARTIIDPAYRNLDPAPFEMIERDVALLQLAEPIPSAVISPFVVARPGNGDEVSVVSYAEGREEALSWQRRCKVVGRKERLIAFDCDVSFGSSGAPVLDRSGYRAKIVSIVSAGGEVDGKPASFGMELPALVDRLKTALRKGDALSVAKPDAKVDAKIDPAPSGLPGTPGKRITVGGGTLRGLGESGGARFVSPP
ncbi:MAG: trypsin-like peptidase domain-containing protein [Rhodobacterales bacterium]|nr:trypsin-like peptidase domain-containing protein [Rhodobacterales bacterium]